MGIGEEEEEGERFWLVGSVVGNVELLSCPCERRVCMFVVGCELCGKRSSFQSSSDHTRLYCTSG